MSQLIEDIVRTPYPPHPRARPHRLRLLSRLAQAYVLYHRSMSQRFRVPSLETRELPHFNNTNHDETSAQATASPARGKEMRQNLLAKLRPPPLVHTWEFWHDRQDRKKPTDSTSAAEGSHTTDATTTSTDPSSASSYESRLVKLHTINDIRDFWSVWNNFDIGQLPLRDSVHLFHKGVKPVWEDARNVRGGAWTFRVPKAAGLGPRFWQEICLMAVGETLQDAVASPPSRTAFRDDLCGVSLSVRFTSFLVTIWHRDADHAEGVRALLETVLREVSPEVRPKEGSYYYKRHSEHAGFKGEQGAAKEKGEESNAKEEEGGNERYDGAEASVPVPEIRMEDQQPQQ